jgi:tRNA (cytidine/uridine-2'-O-)-methyltransferase
VNIVLVNPEIPFNTGNIGRTCVSTNTKLHLVGKLGFEISDKYIKRSAMDYWQHLDYELYDNFEDFLAKIPKDAEMFFFSTKGKKTLWEAKYTPDIYLIFGSESAGFPKDFYTKYEDKLYTIPMDGKVRSLNLSTTAGIVLFEAIRQCQGQW